MEDSGNMCPEGQGPEQNLQRHCRRKETVSGGGGGGMTKKRNYFLMLQKPFSKKWGHIPPVPTPLSDGLG